MKNFKLAFNRDLCLACSSYDCLVKCQYLNLGSTEARSEIRKIISGELSQVLYNCVTCYACEEYCRWGNHPFYLIVERQEEKGILPAPKPIVKRWVQSGELIGREPEIKPVKEPVISLCFFPQLAPLIQGKLFDGASVIYGRHVFCNVVYLHFGKSSIIKERAPIIIGNIAKYGVKELICFHDECYGLFKSLAPAYNIKVPFKPIHLFEYLYNKLMEHEKIIKPLNFKVAYQRNCSTRLTPDKEHFVDDIFELIGVKRVKREYDRENALCCAGIIKELGYPELSEELQRKNVEDMKKADAEYVVFNCPMCYFILAEKVGKLGMKPMLMSELCKLAIGEKPIL
ncbi:MAG: heterodisulfide reductase-related iron-sulfur binding cluster [Candidatus Bathyarchaeota archaeon]